MKLKLKRKHPSNAFRLGRHTITNIFKDFDLNKEEKAELKTAGPSAWVMSEKKPVKNPVKKERIEK